MPKTILFISVFIFLLGSGCKRKQPNINNTKLVEVVETEIAEIKQLYVISWLDSCKVELLPNKFYSYKHNNLSYDSAIIILYSGYNYKDALNYLPLNSKGQWISTIVNSKTVSMKDLYLTDSILSEKSTFEKEHYNSSHFPNYGIVYFKNGKVFGQTAIGGGTNSVKSTLKLGNESYFGTVPTIQHQRLSYFFTKYLYPSN